MIETEIPLVWGPKALPPYNPYVLIKQTIKFFAVLSKYPNNLGGVAGDKTVGPIYQDVDVTPGQKFNYILLVLQWVTQMV